jgi:serine/threonine protein phosphatase PrpC
MLDKSGSCAIVVLLIEKKMFVINVGDSRAIMSYDGCNFCINLSIDHKPNDENE